MSLSVRDIAIREIFDSRGDSTIELALEDGNNRTFTAQIPSGKSRGTNEAAVFTHTEAKTTLKRTVIPKLVKEKVSSIQELDALLIRIDDTKRKSKIGGNVALGISIAASRAIAFEKRKELWELLGEEFFSAARSSRPVIFSNLINGGAHAHTNLAIQEYLVLVQAGPSATEDIRTLVDFYRELGGELKQSMGLQCLPIGDEGGYALNFKDNYEPIALLEALIKKRGLAKQYTIGLDVAASQFYRNGKYIFEGKERTTEELAGIYAEYFHASPLLASTEDPFHETDAEGFKRLHKDYPEKLIVGDDLTATNTGLITQFAGAGAINGVIIKPNQIGTVTETCEAITTAHKHNVKCIISHRSGETEDNFIIHLAKASAAYGVKIGAPAKERVLKFNEFIRLYSEL